MEMGLEKEWDEENTRAYLEVLIDEINDKTPFLLRPIDWKDTGQTKTRLLVKNRQSHIDEVVKSVRFLALSQNKNVQAEKVKSVILKLLEDGSEGQEKI